MYRIYCDGELLYASGDDELMILSGKIKLAVNTTGEFSFSLPPGHSEIDHIQKIKTIVQVYDDDEFLYEGRVLASETDIYRRVTYTCEGILSYLLDSIQRPKTYHNLTPQSYLQDKLKQHNSQVEASKRFTLGTVEKQSMNYDARQDNQYTNTLDTIMDKLVASNGGYIRVRHQEGIRYLDYLETYGRVSGQTIRFGENILDLTEHISAADIITVLIPLGKPPEGAAEGSKLTIASVNNGKDYLEDTEAISLYGRITGTHTWEDVTVPENLKKKGKEYLQNARNLSLTIELTAVDLHMIDVDIDRIKLGDMIRVVSAPHGIDRYMLVSKREYNLVDPSQDKIVLGDTITSLTEKQAQLQKNIEKQKSLADHVEIVQNHIKILSGEMSDTKQELSGMSDKMLVMEANSTNQQEELQTIRNTLINMGTADKKNSDDIQILQVNAGSIQTKLEELETRLKELEKNKGV